MNRILYLVIIGLILIGCSSSETEKSNDLQIRISNVSEFNYDNIKVSTTGEMVDFGNLDSNSKSDYKTFDKAYRYAYVEFQINGKTFILQPTDYFGETLLENGKYAYELNVNIDAQRVFLELKNE